jgi:hypothetical protein
VKGLPSGYHLLRAFLLLPDDDGNGWLCVKSPVAYVEAELFVERPVLPPTRSVSPPLLAVGGNEPMGSLCCSGFMFGQPSLCFLTPRDSVAADKLTAVVVDFFVSNCLIGEVAPGYVTVPCMSCASESVVMSCVTRVAKRKSSGHVGNPTESNRFPTEIKVWHVCGMVLM